MSNEDKLIWFVEFYTESEFSKPLENDRGSLSKEDFKFLIHNDKYYNTKELLKETDKISLEKFIHNNREAIKNFGIMNNEKQYYFNTKNGIFKTDSNEYKLYFVYNSKDINITNYEFTNYTNKIIFNRFFQIVNSESKEKGCVFGYNINLRYKEFDYNSIKMDILYLVDDSEYFQINITSSLEIKYIKLIIEDNQNNSFSKILTLNKDESSQFTFKLK